MPSAKPTDLTFTDDELELLGRTADALSAYMGKSVLAEVVDADETGFEWVIFAIPLDISDDASEVVHVQVGGPKARLLGNRGGLAPSDDAYDCEYLWAVQLCELEGVRFIKVDQEGEEVAWSDDLASILPFMLNDEPPAEDDDESDDDGGDDEGTGADDDDDGGLRALLDGEPPHTLH